MNQDIVTAITTKKRLSVTYNGATRTVDPHAYGLDKNGHGKLRVYQVSDDADHAGWRLFNESAITDLKIIDESFSGAHAGYQAGDKHLTTIIAQL